MRRGGKNALLALPNNRASDQRRDRDAVVAHSYRANVGDRSYDHLVRHRDPMTTADRQKVSRAIGRVDNATMLAVNRAVAVFFSIA
jgi:hypothetical protein